MSPQAGHAARIRLLPSRGGLPPCAKSLSCVRLFATPWTAARQAPLSMGFSRQEYWSGLPCPPPGDLPNPGIEPGLLCLLHWQAGSLPSAPPGKPFFLLRGTSIFVPKAFNWLDKAHPTCLRVICFIQNLLI